jgi:hypothetical protein
MKERSMERNHKFAEGNLRIAIFVAFVLALFQGVRWFLHLVAAMATSSPTG